MAFNSLRKGLLWLLTMIMVLIFTGCGPVVEIFSYRINPDFPKNQDETLLLENLHKPVDVYFDDFGIPHINAENTEDLVKAVGFVQSRYRFFQLDILRRFGKGRISELVGDQKILSSSTIEFDLAMRGWDFAKRSQIDLDTIPEFDRKVIFSFTDGVNQALKRYKPVEYDILGIEPEPWEPSDTLIVTLLQCWSITHNWEQEAVRLSLAFSLGLSNAEEIYPNDPLPGASTLPSNGKGGNFLPPAIAPEIADLFPETFNLQSLIKKETNGKLCYTMGDLYQVRPSASNAWVVNGKRSKSGLPILSNDMHLSHFLPSLIFLQHLKTPEIDIIGATMPGLPFIIGGHNGKLAWGATSAVADVVDLVIEKPDPANPSMVLNESGPCELKKEPVIIRVRKGDAFEERGFTIRRTCNGPLLNDMYPEFLPENAPPVAIKWKLPGFKTAIGQVYKANKAETLEELREAWVHIPIAQNITAADKKGNIAFFSTGAIPVREHHRGTFAAPGWLAKYEWNGWTTAEDMPNSFNPEQGFFANTNNKVVDPFVHQPLFHVDTAPSYRFDRVVVRIKEKMLHDQASIKDIQTDNKVLRAKVVLPHIINDLKKIKEMSSTEQAALKELENWQYFSDAKSSGAAIFFSVYRESIIQALSNKTTEPVIHAFLKQRYSTNTVDIWFEDSRNIVWDDFSTKKQETRSDILHAAFKTAVNKLVSELGDNVNEWNWGHFHYLHPKHLFGGKSILDFMNLEKIGLAGSLDSVWKAHFNLGNMQDTFKVVAGPAFRFVIDFGDIEKAEFCIDTGESGWPLSPHYGDMYEKWKKGELVPMVYNWENIKNSKMAKMTLLPDGN